jgi:TonB family protein
MKPVEHSSEALLPFETLLEHLQRQGFHIGVEHHLRLRVLLDRVADSCEPSELKTLICPLFATNAEQQSLFYRAFDTLYPFLGGAEKDKVDPKSASSVASQPGAIRSWPSHAARVALLGWMVWIGIVGGIIALISTGHRITTNNAKPQPNRGAAVPTGSGTPPITTPTPVAPSATTLTRISLPRRVMQEKLIRKVDPVYPPEAQHAGAQGPVRFNAVIGHDGRVQNLEVVSGHPSLIEAARQAVSQWAYKQTLMDGVPVEVLTQIEVSMSRSPVLTQEPTWYSSPQGTLQWIVVLVPILLWLSYEVYRFRRRSLLIRKAQGKTPPYSWPIRTDFAPDIYDPHDLAMVSRALHRRYQGESGRLDVAQTVEASVAALGFPTFRYRKDSRLPEYLFLIDRASFRDHQAHLYEHLASVLRGQGLYVSAYFYEGDPRVCWSSSGAESLYLEQLQQICAGHRLVVFGNGDQLLDAVSGRIVEWHELLAAWPERALLTPEAPSQWGTRELTLATQFAIAPATLEGLLAVAGYFELPSSMEFRSWDGRGVQGRIDSADAASALRRYLGEDAFQWLCACAIYPDLQWDLTLCLGALPAMASGLVCEENIVKLLRLEWFRSGSMPDSLRRALIAELNPETEQEVRGAIIGLLESNPPPEGTFAAGSHQFHIAYQRYRNSPKDRKAERRLKNLLENLPPDEVTQDYAYLDAAESVSRSPLQLVIPRRLLKAFYPSGVPLFGMWTYARVLVAAGIVLGTLQILRVLDRPLAVPPLTPRIGTPITVQINVSPPDAVLTVNGRLVGVQTSTNMTGSGTVDLVAGGKYDVVVSRVGYKTLQEPAKLPGDHWSFALDPEPVRLHISTSAKRGRVFIDGTNVGDFSNDMTDLAIKADGTKHSIALFNAIAPLVNGTTNLLSFAFVAKPGEAPQVIAFAPGNLIIVSSLGSDATVYSGVESFRANLSGHEPRQVPVTGLKLTGISVDHNILEFSGKDLGSARYHDLQKIPIETSDAPHLYVGLNVDTDIAVLSVQMPVAIQTARLRVDGNEIITGRPENWTVVCRSGPHTIKVTAPGYDDFTQQVELIKDQPQKLFVELKPMATYAILVIEGGTPAAEVSVDGYPKASLNSNGYAKIAVTPGIHRITFRLNHYETSEPVTREFSLGQETKLGPKDATLRKFGLLQFKVTPPDAQISLVASIFGGL